MRITTTLLAACLCAALVNSLPLSGQGLRSQSLDRLMVVEAENDSAQRNKRTIGILRQLFPEVSKMIEDKVNAVIGEVFKIFGPVVFQSLLGRNKPGGNGGNGGGGLAAGGTGSAKSSGTTVEAKNPFDDEDEDDDWFKSKEDNETGSKISLDFPPDENDDDSKTVASSTTARPASSSSSSASSNDRIDTITLETTPANAENITSNAVQ